jgi:hypothetical protein
MTLLDLDEAQKKLEEFGEDLGKAKKFVETGTGIVESLGVDLLGVETGRQSDGGWIVNGKVYPGNEKTFGDCLNSDLPDWFPFGELALQLQIQLAARNVGKEQESNQINPTPLAQVLCVWVKAGLKGEQIETLVAAEPTIGLSSGYESTPSGLRAYWCNLLLLAALKSEGLAPTFNKITEDFSNFWRGEGRCREIGAAPDAANKQKVASMGVCVGIPLSPDGRTLADLDEFGRLASPSRGDQLERARAILRFLQTGEVMQETPALAGSFAGFESCVRSGDQTCLANYTPSSPDFWAALREPWRFGYVKGKKVQVVENTFGRFIAWDFGKPRGITVTAAIAISLPAVIAIGTIAALTFYAKGKTGR